MQVQKRGGPARHVGDSLARRVARGECLPTRIRIAKRLFAKAVTLELQSRNGSG
jgi:hypothetical protein